MFINGHLHNGQYITPKILNLGNLTGKDFGEDASKHVHGVIIIDTSTLEIEFIENPYAYNFYKIQINTEQDLTLLENLKNQAVVSIKCDEKLINATKLKLESLQETIVDSRLIIIKQFIENSETANIEDLTVDHLARFVDCCKMNIEYSNILEEELAEVCK